VPWEWAIPRPYSLQTGAQPERHVKAVLDIVLIVLDLMIWILIIQAVLSWLLIFNVVNMRNQIVSSIWRFTSMITQPLLKPIQRIMPTFNGLDLSPLVLMLGIFLIQRVIIYYVYPNVF
jgi:YggT family protein